MPMVLLQVVSVLSLVFSVFSESATFQRRQNSLSPPYMSATWDTYGSAMIEPRHVRLTGDVASQSGGIFNTAPMTTPNWLVEITFHVHGHGKSIFGDGFAFWYTNQALSKGPAFGAQSSFRGLALFFDTYANQNGHHSHEHPYISAMVNDGSRAYDHDKDGTHTEFAGCSTNFRSQDRVKAIIRYENRRLKVSLQYANKKSVVDCFDAANVILPTGYFFGLSAMTGELSDNHDIYSVIAYEIVSNEPINIEELNILVPSAGSQTPEREHVQDDKQSSRSSRILWFLLKWIFIVAIVGGCIFLAYRYYNRREFQRRRLY